MGSLALEREMSTPSMLLYVTFYFLNCGLAEAYHDSQCYVISCYLVECMHELMCDGVSVVARQ